MGKIMGAFKNVTRSILKPNKMNVDEELRNTKQKLNKEKEYMGKQEKLSQLKDERKKLKNMQFQRSAPVMAYKNISNKLGTASKNMETALGDTPSIMGKGKKKRLTIGFR